MKGKILSSMIVFLGLTLYFLSISSLQAMETNPSQEEKTVYIPKEVKKVIEKGMESRQARQDIPFEVFRHLYLPASENVHSIFFFKIKNSDLGYVPMAAAGTQEKKEEQPERAKEASTSQGMLQTKTHAFLQFNRLDVDFEREVYVPVNFQIEEAAFAPEKEVICTIGYPLPPGNYLLSLAIASQDLKKIGTQYFEFTLPDTAEFTDTLDTTPIFFIDELKRMPSPEMKVEIHKEYFTYSVLKIKPNLEKTFSSGKNLDIFLFVYGAKPNPDGTYAIDATYQVLQDDKPIIKFAGTKYDTPIISQPLPLKKTVIVQTTKGEEKTEKKETKELEPGVYTLKMGLKCSVTGFSVTKITEFTIE